MTTPEGRGAPERARLDKWLWRARIYKTRALAAAAVSGGKVRVNGARTVKPGHALKEGDVLTISRAGRGGLVLALRALGERRGPAAEARTLYEDLSAAAAETATRADEAIEADPESAAPPAAGEAKT